MELLNKNFLDTSTMISVGSNTLLAERILYRDKTLQWFTDGFNDDATTCSMTITFDSTQTVSRLALIGMNLKGFTVFYNGTTANTFALTSTGSTSTSDFSANSETSMFMFCTPVACSSITIDMKTTQMANSEKALSYLYIGSTLLDFEKIPAASQYTPRIVSEQVVHKMADGGTKINVKSRKQAVDVKLKYVSKSWRDDLLTIFEDHSEFAFVAFPTMTAWDEVLFPCVWENDWEFDRFSDNNPSAGFDGTIKLKEIPT